MRLTGFKWERASPSNGVLILVMPSLCLLWCVLCSNGTPRGIVGSVRLSYG